MPAEPKKQAQYTPTYLEAPEEVQDVIEALRQQQKASLTPSAKGAPQPAAVPGILEDTQAFVPQKRPPLTLLCILDDGKKDEGEWVRLRSNRIVLGRNEGDIRLPFDERMSGRHAELVRTEDEGWRWNLVDLGSTNGTFVRIAKSGLHDQNEVLIGSGRYRFELPATGVLTEPLVQSRHAGTINWEGEAGASSQPSLVEVISKQKLGQRYPLVQPEYWIGRDAPSCAILRPGDLFTSSRHARLFRDSKNAHHWVVENHKSINGVWLRVERIQLGRTCNFQLGEQRFLLKVLQ